MSKENIKERLFKCWITTILGAIVILASVASVFVADMTWGEASIGIGAGTAILFMKDDKLKSLLPVLIIGIMAMSCSPQNRLNKLINNHPELAVQDTIHFTDTLISERVEVDTLFSVERFFNSDTVIIEKERLKLEFINTRDSVFINAVCEDDTLIIEKYIPYTKYEILERSWWSDHWFSIVITILMALGGLWIRKKLL